MRWNLIRLLLSLLPVVIQSAIAQTWSAPVQTIDATSGSGGFSGSFSKLLVLANGNPAMADNAGGAYGSNGYLRYLYASDPSGAGSWKTVIVDTAAGTGAYLSLEIVNGNPAISYYDQVNGNLKFVRATNPSGSAWGVPITIDAAGDVGQHTSLQTFNNRAQISYYDVTNGDLKYIRAINADASAWGPPVTIDATDNVGQYTALAKINGKPAIAFYDVTNADLKYAVSSDLNGNSPWSITTLDAAGDVGRYASLQEVNGSAAVSYYDYRPSFFGTKGVLKFVILGSPAKELDGGTASSSIDVGQYTSLQIVDGFPAISYLDNYLRRLKYIRASDANGNTWNTAPAIAASQGGFYSSLQVINGVPAIAYHDQTNFDLKYVRATDATGAGSWGNSKTFDVLGFAGGDISLQFVAGFPAIVYSTNPRDYSSNNSLLYVRATDAGGTQWGTPVTIDATGGRDVSLQIVDGKPAISYASQSGNIKYVIAKDAVGAGWETPITVDGATGGAHTTLKIVNGRPAISYRVYNYPDAPIKYARANDPSGLSPWPTPVIVDATGGSYPSLQIINNNPAISFSTFNNDYNNPAGALKFIRSDDTDGNGWTTAAVQTGGDIGLYNSLQMVDGRPAISYYDQTNKDLKFIRSSDINGTTWNFPPVTIDATGVVGIATSLQIVNNNPAISYYDVENSNLKYVQANDPLGADWGTPSTLAPGNGEISSMDTTANADPTKNMVGIAYQNAGLPYYISGGFHSMLATGTTTVVRNITGNATTDVNNGIYKLVSLTPTGGANALNGDVTTTVTIDASVQTYNNHPYVQRHYDITPVINASAAQATITLYFTQQEFDNFNTYVTTNNSGIPLLPTGGLDNGNLRITQFHGGYAGPSEPGNYNGNATFISPSVVWDNANSWWEVTFAVTGFSGFYLSTGNNALPLTLLQFTGSLDKTTVNLAWSTSNEVGIKEFVVERSNANGPFAPIGTISAQSTSVTHLYRFPDLKPGRGNNYYRLKVTDRNGGFIYTAVLKVFVGEGRGSYSVYPNPLVSNLVNLQFINQPKGVYNVRIINQSGQVMLTKSIIHSEGSSTETIELSKSIQKGHYLLEVITPDNSRRIIKIVY